ncbi:MAG: hypothetical protein ACERKN_17800 [Velocimicrobium sp.]
MKKSVIIFIILLSILSFSSCGTQSGKLPKVVANTPESVKSSTHVITSKAVYNCGNCAIQGEKIYYANSYDNGILYSINTEIK